MIRHAVLLCIVLTYAGAEEPLDRAVSNRSVWEHVLQQLEGTERARAQYLLEELPLLDLLESDEITILNHVGLCTKSTLLFEDYDLPEDTLRAYLLWPTTSYLDHMTDWRPLLRQELDGLVQEGVDTTVDSVVAFLCRRVRIDERKDLFGPSSPPVGTYRRRWGNERERASLLVAGLRSVGIAAKLGGEGRWVQYWHGGWCGACVPPGCEFDAGDLSEETVTSIPDAELELVLRLHGLPHLSEEGVGLARWEEGRWRPVIHPEVPMAFHTTDSSMVVRTVPGTYLATVGIRNARGEPRVWAKEVRLQSGVSTRLVCALDIPFEELSEDDLVGGKSPELDEVVLYQRSGETVLLNDMIGKAPLVLVLMESGAELSERLIEGLLAGEEECRAQGATLVIVGLSEEAGAAELIDKDRSLSRALGIEEKNESRDSELPQVLVFASDGELLLRRSGYHTRLMDLIVYTIRNQQSSGSG